MEDEQCVAIVAAILLASDILYTPGTKPTNDDAIEAAWKLLGAARA